MNKIVFILYLLALSMFSSCKKDSPASNPDSGFAYFPGEVGNFVIYEGDSTIYDDFKKDTTYIRFQLKERIESIFPDNEGRPALRTERYMRYYNPNKPYDSIPWQLKGVCYSVKTTALVERLENNVRYVKLVFPVKEGKKWNGNALNTKGEWEYEYTETDVSLGIGSYLFDSTLTVLQRDELTIFTKQYYKEKYVKNVGLVYREVIDVESDNPNQAIPILGRVKKGVLVNWKIVSFGRE